MATELSTKVTELPESRVRVEAQVAPGEIERSVQRAARQLGRDLRIPGFRRGKVPPPVIIKRIGREAVLDEAVRDALPAWYSDAIDAAGIHPIGDPELDVGALPDQGEPLTFSIEIGVRPRARLGTYRGLEVGRAEPEIGDDAVDQDVEVLRDRLARLETVERAAASGDFVLMDYAGAIDGVPFAGGEGRDQLSELGAGRLVPGFEEQLEGAAAGDERTVTITFPDDYGADELKGRTADFAVAVKEVKAKLLPELDDELAEQAGFDSLDELREDVRTRLREAEEQRLEAAFRETALDAAVAVASVDIPESLVQARMEELWGRMLHSLEHRGVDRDTYLRIAGRTEDELKAEAQPEAEQQLRREAVVAAIVEAEGLEVSDDDVREALEATAEREGGSATQLFDRLRSTGRLEEARDDLAQRRAIELVAESATPISVAQAQARDVLWTPAKESAAGGSEPAATQLWTPGT